MPRQDTKLESEGAEYPVKRSVRTTRMPSPLLQVVFAVLVTTATSFAVSADWSSCADDLDRLRRAAGDAADAAEQTKSKAEELENCRRYPDTYDLMRDRCRSYASDYDSEVSSFQSEMDDVDRRIRDASDSCSVDIGASSGTTRARPSSGNRLCDLYRRYKGRLPDAQLLQTCRQSLSADDCKKCLAN